MDLGVSTNSHGSVIHEKLRVVLMLMDTGTDLEVWMGFGELIRKLLKCFWQGVRCPD
jgi:hypothetical protein